MADQGLASVSWRAGTAEFYRAYRKTFLYAVVLAGVAVAMLLYMSDRRGRAITTRDIAFLALAPAFFAFVLNAFAFDRSRQFAVAAFVPTYTFWFFSVLNGFTLWAWLWSIAAIGLLLGEGGNVRDEEYLSLPLSLPILILFGAMVSSLTRLQSALMATVAKLFRD